MFDMFGLILLMISLYLWCIYYHHYIRSSTRFTNASKSETKANSKDHLTIASKTTTKKTTTKTTTTVKTRAKTKTNFKKKIKVKSKKKIICPSYSNPGNYDLQPLDVYSNQTKQVLFWNAPSDWNDKFEKCEYKNCKMTFDKCDFPRSHAVLFHAPNLSVKHIPRKIPGQVWILLNYEPPEQSKVNLWKWKNKFNWTWSYRRDSDISVPYFDFTPINPPQNRNFSGISKKKSKLATWFVSHCKTESKREKYMKQLQNFVNVDVYGKCGPFKCKYDARKCYDMLNTMYKFYMGFENSHCADYITEKAYAYMELDIVLVLRGGYLKELYLPPHSYVDTSSFSSVKKLAAYLQSLSKNNTEYEKYFNWKNHYGISRKTSPGLCQICKRLHQLTKHEKVYNDIQKWSTTKKGEYICDKNPKDYMHIT